MHKFIGEVGYVGTDTEMYILLQDAQIRKFLENQGIRHYCLFFVIANPDGVTSQTATFARMLTSEKLKGMAEVEYINKLWMELTRHLRMIIEDYTKEGEQE